MWTPAGSPDAWIAAATMLLAVAFRAEEKQPELLFAE